MAVIDFIEADVRKRRGPLALALGVGVAGAAVLLGLALGWRDDYRDAVTAATVWPALGMALFVALLPLLLLDGRLSTRTRYSAAVAAGLGVIILSLLSPTFPGSVVSFSAAEAFWRGCASCLGKGLAFGLPIGMLFAVLWDRWLPSPSSRGRAVLAGVVGLAGVLLLDLHCSTTAPSHLVVAHWGQLALLLGPLYFFQRWLAARRVARALDERAERVPRLARITDGL